MIKAKQPTQSTIHTLHLTSASAKTVFHPNPCSQSHKIPFIIEKQNGCFHFSSMSILVTCANICSCFSSCWRSVFFPFISDPEEDKISVSLSICPVNSCLPPHTVSFPHRRRGEQKKKKSLPLLSHSLSKLLPITVFLSTLPSVPSVCPPASLRPLDMWSSSHHTSQIILLWLLPAGLWGLCPGRT